MRKLKRDLSLLLSFVFMVALVQMPMTARAEAKNNEKVYVKIRYNRPDANYDGWNLWVWEKDKEGKQVDFIGEDSEGKFAVVETTKGADKLGFIIRKSEQGNDWVENYTGDVLVDLANGDQEAIVKHIDTKSTDSLNVENVEVNEEKEASVENKEGKEVSTAELEEDVLEEVAVSETNIEEVATDEKVTMIPLNRDFDKVTLNLHYYRFDGNYDEWDIWSWLDGVKGGFGYPLGGQDDYGKIATIEYENVVNADKRGIGIIIRKPDWSAKDVDTDRFINLAYANNDGELNAYFVQSNSDIVYRAEDAITAPAVVSAKMDSLNEISFSLNGKLPSNDINGKVTVKEINEKGEETIINLVSVTVSETLLSGKVTTETKLDLTKNYTLEIEGFAAKELTLGKIYGSEDFADLYHYDGQLGAIYSKEKTNFVLWAPTASNVVLQLFNSGDYVNDNTVKEAIPMTKGENGIWTAEKSGDLNGTYYTYSVTTGLGEKEVTDPYAKAVGVNGKRTMVIDLATTNPTGWENDTKPEFIDATDAVIYELHIRDFTIDESSGASMEVMGKYNGIWQSGNTLPGNGDIKTGIDHLKELGITHLHLLPTFDHRSIDETNLGKEQYNWGYDPQNYNVPEGSYSSDPYKAEIRIKEFKEMVMELHKAGIRVVMDVVYNHTGASADSHLNLAVPDYYYRQNADGGFSNGSGCGNELASERSMVRKMMVDSLVYWATEYHIDGFRFDLMALHDIETMKTIRTELDKVDDSILIYGEGWTGGDTPLPEEDRALKKNTVMYDKMQIAAFSDDMRDGIKGHVFDDNTPGFINGYNGVEEMIKFGIVASTKHEEVNYGNNPSPYEGYATEAWANEPYQTVNYYAAHDNLTLWDKLQTTNKDASEEKLVAMNKMAGALVLTSQGIPFLHAGDEMARTKVNPDGSFNHNSYNAPDSVNKIDWTRKEEYNDLFHYYKGLIELRKSHKSFRMNTNADIQSGIDFLEKGTNFAEDNVVAYTIDGAVTEDNWDNIAVIFNANEEAVEVTLPNEQWTVVVNENQAGINELAVVEGNTVTVPAQASYVLVDTKSFNTETDTEEPDIDVPGEEEDDKTPSDDKDEDKKPSEDKEENKPGKLPQTGQVVGIAAIIAIGLMATVSGIFMVRKKRVK